jgi:hypothetical protein
MTSNTWTSASCHYRLGHHAFLVLEGGCPALVHQAALQREE